jgi:hypothetical protein
MEGHIAPNVLQRLASRRPAAAGVTLEVHVKSHHAFSAQGEENSPLYCCSEQTESQNVGWIDHALDLESRCSEIGRPAEFDPDKTKLAELATATA